MIHVPEDLRDALETHARRGYPAEVCGILLGYDGEPRRVTEVREAPNLRASTTRDRYEIDPEAILKADRAARTKGEAIVGFYHSHPDHPAAPSAFDTERAWPWYTYLILSTDGEDVREVRAWRREDAGMAEESLRFIKGQPVGGGEHGQT